MSTPAPFSVGDKVVCVDDSIGATSGLRTLRIGTVYHVAGIGTCSRTGKPKVYILGINLGSTPCGIPIGFRCTRFRRVWTQSASVSV